MAKSPKPHLQPLAVFLSHTLKLLKLKAIDLSKESGVPKSIVYDLLSCHHEPKPESLYKIAASLARLTGKPYDFDYLYTYILIGKRNPILLMGDRISFDGLSDMQEFTPSPEGIARLIALLSALMQQNQWDLNGLAQHINRDYSLISTNRLDAILSGNPPLATEIAILATLRLVDTDGQTLDIEELMNLIYPEPGDSEEVNYNPNGVGNGAHS